MDDTESEFDHRLTDPTLPNEIALSVVSAGSIGQCITLAANPNLSAEAQARLADHTEEVVAESLLLNQTISPASVSKLLARWKVQPELANQAKHHVNAPDSIKVTLEVGTMTWASLDRFLENQGATSGERKTLATYMGTEESGTLGEVWARIRALA
ncbi:hypothetical protein [Pseudoclavibacter sp. JSM 162008]|uniref:hypothetical protein n=1 Tax=Pseudoclavibacter sp. JSM 162008 TaxID=3229855 RepID=UPI003524D2C9